MPETRTPTVELERALTSLLELSRRAREARSEAELAFLLVNESHRLVPYRQAALWRQGSGVQTLSGLVQPDAHTPYAQWLEGLCRHLGESTGPQPFTSANVPQDVASAWAEWWPTHALWLPLGTAQHPAALLLARDAAWTPADVALLSEWMSIWTHARTALQARRHDGWLGRWRRDVVDVNATPKRWWRRPLPWLVIALLAFSAVPVRLTVLAPGELVPVNPVVVRAPLDGVIDTFHVQPNQSVRKGDPLFGFDEALIQSRLAVARQTLATAGTEYRQTLQQALTDARARTQLAALQGRIQEKRAEVALLEEQLTRARVLAPQDGVALFDDPGEWIGKPVDIGQRILRLAATGDVEVEAWVPIGDAIVVQEGSPVRLFLNAQPLEPVQARLRYMAYEAVQRPDGSFAHRIRATLAEPTAHRVGLKGTARLEGDRVPAIWWVMRRPVATLRTTLGL